MGNTGGSDAMETIRLALRKEIANSREVREVKREGTGAPLTFSATVNYATEDDESEEYYLGMREARSPPSVTSFTSSLNESVADRKEKVSLEAGSEAAESGSNSYTFSDAGMQRVIEMLSFIHLIFYLLYL